MGEEKNPVFLRFSVEGKKALVTGGSKGLGAEIAITLASAGADVSIVGRDRDGLEETKLAIESIGKTCQVIYADLSTITGVRDVAQKALGFWGTIDILVNNAGVAHIDDLISLSLDSWEETMAVNLRAPFLLTQLVVPAMINQEQGRIINITSQAGVVGVDGHGAYSASKGGLNLLTKVMASEWGRFNITSNAIAPTVILTKMGCEVWGDPAKSEPILKKIPLNRFGDPTDVSSLVLFLASSAAGMINGEVILLDGGYTSVA